MASTPKFKAFDPEGEYVACFKHLEDAAAFVAFRGNGSCIREGHDKRFTLWTEGSEAFPAGESYDRAALVMHERLEAFWQASRARSA